MQKLRVEHDFSFNKTNVPQKLVTLLNEIEDNKRKWKSLYVAVWGFSLYHLIPIIEEKHGDEFGVWSLPAFRLGGVTYKHNELNKYLTNYDSEIHISHLIKIFTLLENYLYEYYEITKSKQNFVEKIFISILYSRFIKHLSKISLKIRNKIDKYKSKYNNPKLDFSNYYVLRKYINKNGFATKKEISELDYAKETRNSFVHRRGLVNKRWLKTYRRAGGKDPLKICDILPLQLHDLEDWTDIVINIVNKSLNTFSIDRHALLDNRP